jgi:hypothetical protein
MLPYDKYQAWKNDIDSILQHSKSNANELEALIGRLGHVGTIIPFVHYHFISRLRELQWKARKNTW